MERVVCVRVCSLYTNRLWTLEQSVVTEERGAITLETRRQTRTAWAFGPARKGQVTIRTGRVYGGEGVFGVS